MLQLVFFLHLSFKFCHAILEFKPFLTSANNIICYKFLSFFLRAVSIWVMQNSLAALPPKASKPTLSACDDFWIFNYAIFFCPCLEVAASEDDDAAHRGRVCCNSRSDRHHVALLHSQNRGRTPRCLLQVPTVLDGTLVFLRPVYLYVKIRHIKQKDSAMEKRV